MAPPKSLGLLIISSLVLFVIILQLNAETFVTQNPCIAKVTCSECIQTPSCAWCALNNSLAFKNYPRCFQPAGQYDGPICPEQDLYYPSNKYVIISGHALHAGKGAAGGVVGGGAGGGGGASGGAFGSGSGSFEGSYSESSYSESVQITPQYVKLQLRAGESHQITLKYAQAEDYPVDLYYLMDLSKSMEDDKDKLSTLGDLLSSTMRNMTSNFQLGFGSFVDKVVMPYVSTVPFKLKMPCTNCTAPYGYKNHLTLSNDTTKFSTMVKEARVSGNLDAPEGGFDAIMQAVVCKDAIGWRNKSRRLLVFSTDAGFHYAGDGKLGGIIKPNDGRCHLNGGSYSYSKIQDYPSISQLNLKVKQNLINVIFAVTKDQIGVYDKLKYHIEGSTSGMLSDDSSNVVELVKKQYEAISAKVELKDNATGGVEIKYYTKCLNLSATTENNTNICEKFEVGQEIAFKLDVFLRECPKDPSKWKQIIEVYPVAVSESLIIELEMLCSCPCEHPGNPGYIPRASECSFAGTYKCGVCACDELHFGRKCECTPGSYQEMNQTKGCKPPNQPDVADCSGRGQCVCNQCECYIRDNIHEQITGTYCECDNFSCYRSGSEICGGPEHGTCICGECRCEHPWVGQACDCYNLTDKCYSTFDKSDTKLICNGHGKCVCGACQCDSTEAGKYTGRFCERCPNCTETCDELKPCVLCQIYEVGPYSKEECVQKCRNFTPKEVDVVQANEQESEFACAGYDDEDCRFVFVYKKINSTHYEISAQRDRECPAKVFLLGIVLGVIAAVVLMGLAILLLWKLLTTIHDRREFAKFEKERMMAKWDTGENPIYKQATSTFKNPTYAGKG